MEWREQTAVGCEVAFSEAQRWMEEVTMKRFGSSNFRSALENGVLLCDLINKLKPGIIKRVNRLSTPIAGLDNVNVFLKACGKLGLNNAQLFHPGDLQDVSTRVTVRHQETSRRLKNVLITIYWLGRKAHADPSYNGPQLNFKAFEGLLGIALSKALEEASSSKPGARDSGFAETWYPDREVPSYRREDSAESLDSVESRTRSVPSDYTLIAGSEGFGSDAEAEHCFRMTEPLSAPSRDRRNNPAVLRRKRVEQREEGGRGHVSPLHSENGRGLVNPCFDLPPVSAFHQWALDYQSDSESDSDRPEPDPVQDDLAGRRFRSSTSVAPANFAVPPNPACIKPFPMVTPSASRSWVTMSDASRLVAVPHERSSQSISSLPSRADCYGMSTLDDELLLRALDEDSSESGEGSADPVQDDLYTRRVLQATRQTSVNTDTDKFLPKYWTPEEAAHVGRIRLGSQRRPWYKKMQGFRSKSMSDLNLEPGAEDLMSRHRKAALKLSLRQEQIRQCQSRLRESEATWQEDLNSWKTRRRSVTSDLHRKKEEREQLEEQRRSLPREESFVSSTATAEAFAPPPLTSSSGTMPGPVISPGSAPAHTGRSHSNGPVEATPHSAPVANAVSDHMPSVSGTDSAPAPVQRAKSLEGVFSGTPQMSSVLPRGFRRSEGTSRLSTGVTPRPFSSKKSRMSTQARFYSMDESDNSAQDLAASFPLRGTDTTPDHKDDVRSSKHEAALWKEKGKRTDSAPSVRSFMSASVLVSDKAASGSGEDETHHHDIRVSLNQTPDCGADFGFQTHWDSTGAHITSVRAGSPAQLCHLQAGDEIVALAGQRVAEMSYEQWKANMDAALREGKLLMDIRRISLNGHSDAHSSVGSSVSSCSLPEESESKAQVNGLPVNGFPLKATRTSSREDSVPTRNKGSSAFTVDSSVYLCGGSESAISDLQVPSIGASSSCWSWNAEEERMRQEKWQMEQESLLQEKYRRDQERLVEAWRRDQQEAALEENSIPEVPQPLEKQEVPSLPTGSIAHYTPPPFVQRSKSPSSVAPDQAREATLVHSKQVQIAAAGHPAEDESDSSSRTSHWPVKSCEFTKLTASDRKKSKSTPSLEGSHRQDTRAGVKKKKASPSPAEQERLQILEEMRKKTPVLTDSSWIRQRSTCTIHKEPISVAPLRRHESLDNIHSGGSSVSLSKQSSVSSRTLSGLKGPYRGYSGRCSLGPGAAIFTSALRQSSWSRPSSMSPAPDAEEACNRTQQQDRLASPRRLCSRCEQLLVKGPAMVIESLDLCFHVGCFKCVSCRTDLRTCPESGAHVRVRHRQLFCDTCYNRLRDVPK
ncbi:LIM domain only protein 7b isoform X6 [Tachysurus vachellii]|uniref:LIM domain only protein 7b isoform X6 n=1 Tax=Tachysurus vachellii TaxID=175792 RepID=UPI00296B1E6A|nr:LIM domain only protein 7b isoform X6 [Tachysurus vachellii]